MSIGGSYKIIYVYSCFTLKGGAERVITDKMNWLVSHGHDVTFVTYEQGEHPLSYPLDPRVKHIDTETRFFVLDKKSIIPRLILKYRMKLLFFKKLQDIVDEICPNFVVCTTDFLPTCDIITKLKTSAKFVIESHTTKNDTLMYSIQESSAKRIFRKLKAWVQYKKVKKFNVLVTLTEGDALEWKPLAKSVAVIPNPVTFFPDTIPIKTIHKRIIAVGRLFPVKAFDKLIDAFSRVSDECEGWRLDIFGDGPEKERLLEYIDFCRMNDSVFINSSTHMIYDEYLKSDFCVLSSRNEGFGLVLIEAMSCGIPCVSFRCKYGPEDIISDGEDGLLVEDGNVDELAAKIKWMCNHDKERLKMGTFAREKSKLFRKDIIMEQWIDLFDRLCIK